jgi:hypothetical protein
VSDEPRPSNALSWVLSILAVLVMGAGQLLYTSGSRGLGMVLVIAGGVALAAVIARAALRGLR